MGKLLVSRPQLFLLYGFPGSGKSFFSRQLSEVVSAARVSEERIRFELFEQPQYDKQEHELIRHLMDYMAEELLSAGVSVIYDANANNLRERRALRDMARKHGADSILVWFQVDAETSYSRVKQRDKRRADDKYTPSLDRATFDKLLSQMQNPKDEDYIVVSGKHTFNAQRDTILKRLQMAGLLNGTYHAQEAIKPGLVNLVPRGPGRVDMSRRNITIQS
jgi:predicted kinase